MARRRSYRLSMSTNPLVPFTGSGSDSETSSDSAASEATSETPESVLHNQCSEILEYISQKGLTLGSLLVAVCYGTRLSREDEAMQAARASVYETNNLQAFLQNSYKPSRAASGGGKRPPAGTKCIQQFALSTATALFSDELKRFSNGFTVTPEQLSDQNYLETVTLTTLHEHAKLNCPQLHAMYTAITGVRGEADNDDLDVSVSDDESDDPEDQVRFDPRSPIRKHPQFGIAMQIASLAYKKNPWRNKLQKIIGIYLKAKHTSKAAFYILNQAGITVSYDTIRTMVSSLSVDIHHQMMLAAKTQAIVIVHDNIRIKFGVSSQRADNQAVGDNGTAISMLILPDDLAAHALQNPDDWGPFSRVLNAKRQEGTSPMLTFGDMNSLPRRKRNRTAAIHDILDLLKFVPGLSDSEVWADDVLKRPAGPEQLPHGPDLQLKQYMLATVNIDESSYSGNSQIIPYVLQQLELDSIEELNRLALERRVIWVGDQMTAQRCRQVQLWRQASCNTVNRWQPYMFVFGGFHTQMALSAAILELYRGATTGVSLAADVILLSCTGLEKKKGQKRHNFHDVDELLLHEAEAHVRAVFEALTGCTTSDETCTWLKQRNATDLYQLAEKIYKDHASSAAAAKLETDDEMRPTIIRRTRDLLMYYALRRAFCHGDVNRFEDLLPELLFFFAGSGHGLYAKEIMEFLQLIWHDVTPDLRSAIMRHGILVNRRGRANSFYPIDLQQEFNNKALRELGPPPQSSSWEQYAKISHVIPFLQDIVTHVEHHITGIKHSQLHKNPKHERDVQALMKKQRDHQIHCIVAERKVPKENKSKDALENGTQAIQEGSMLKEFHHSRSVYFSRISTEQIFQDDNVLP